MDEIIIGKIADFNAAMIVYLKDITTGLVSPFQTTSSGDGTVSIDTTDNMFAENHSYEAWITFANEGIEDKEDITIGDDTCTTIELNFQDVNLAAETFPYSSITVEAA